MDIRRHRSSRTPGWLTGFPVAVGVATGAFGTAYWRSASAGYHRCTAATDSLDCLAVPTIQFLVGVPIGVATIWTVLAIAEFRVWIPPIVTLGGLATGTYALHLLESAISDGHPPPIWIGAAMGGVAFGAVAFACLPTLPWAVRILVVVALLATAATSIAVG